MALVGRRPARIPLRPRTSPGTYGPPLQGRAVAVEPLPRGVVFWFVRWGPHPRVPASGAEAASSPHRRMNGRLNGCGVNGRALAAPRNADGGRAGVRKWPAPSYGLERSTSTAGLACPRLPSTKPGPRSDSRDDDARPEGGRCRARGRRVRRRSGHRSYAKPPSARADDADPPE